MVMGRRNVKVRDACRPAGRSVRCFRATQRPTEERDGSGSTQGGRLYARYWTSHSATSVLFGAYWLLKSDGRRDELGRRF
jgi:hypothetical protein